MATWWQALDAACRAVAAAVGGPVGKVSRKVGHVVKFRPRQISQSNIKYQYTFDQAGGLPTGWLGHVLTYALCSRAWVIDLCYKRGTFGYDPNITYHTPCPDMLSGCGYAWWKVSGDEWNDTERRTRAVIENDESWIRNALNMSDDFRSLGWRIANPPPKTSIHIVGIGKAERDIDDNLSDGARWLLWGGELIRYSLAARGVLPKTAPQWWAQSLATWNMPVATRILDAGNAEYTFPAMASCPWSASEALLVLRFLSIECAAPGYRKAPWGVSISPGRKQPVYYGHPSLGSLLWPTGGEILAVDAALMAENRKRAWERLLPSFQAGIAVAQIIVSVMGSYVGGAAGPALGAAVGAAGQAAMMAGSGVLTSSLLRVFRGFVVNPSGGIDWGGVVEGAVDGSIGYASGAAGSFFDAAQFTRFSRDDYRRVLVDGVATLDSAWGWGREAISGIAGTADLSTAIDAAINSQKK